MLFCIAQQTENNQSLSRAAHVGPAKQRRESSAQRALILNFKPPIGKCVFWVRT